MSYEQQAMIHQFLPEKTPEIGHLQETFAERPQIAVVERLRHGFPVGEFYALRDLLKISEEDLASYVGISTATLHRRKKSAQLETPESERIVRFARLFGLAMEIFSSEEGAREWLKASNPGTAGESPLSYADTEYGAREVENLLGRIDRGVFG